MQKLFLGLVIIVVVWCGGCCRDYTCEQGSFSPMFIGFDSTETDTIIVRRFNTGTAFTNPIDTTLVKALPCIGDTSCIGATLQDGFSYEIFIPAVMRTVRVDDIQFINKTVHDRATLDKPFCRSNVSSYRVDGQVIAPSSQSYGQPFMIYR